MKKLGHKGALPGSRDQLLNCGTPLISLERLKIQTSLHLWFCINISITIVIGLPNLFQNTGDSTIVLVVQINKMIALFILFVFIVLGKFRLYRCYATKDGTTVIRREI